MVIKFGLTQGGKLWEAGIAQFNMRYNTEKPRGEIHVGDRGSSTKQFRSQRTAHGDMTHRLVL